ncbi:MAG: hypothetical protein OXL95_02870, partial [Nitrospira sp.]|nr:hypothetical protein [Nitrospira sp.]
MLRITQHITAALLALPLSGAFAPAALAQSQPTLFVGVPYPISEVSGPVDFCIVGVSSGTQSSPLTVNLRISQTGDFLASGETGDKTLVKNPNDAVGIYSINIDNDTVDEPDGTITCTLLPGSGYAIASGEESGTDRVIDDDPTIVTLARVGSGTVSEGDGIEFTVTLSRELVVGEMIEVPLSINISNLEISEFRLSKKRGRGVNTGVKLLRLRETFPSVRFSGAGARVARLILTPLHDDANEGTETYTVALQSNTRFDESGRFTNVGGGADPHPSQNSFSVPVRNVGVPARCTAGNFDRNAGCVWITGGTSVIEGGNVTFTVHADPAPPGDPAKGHGLEVKLLVHDAQGFQDYLNGGDSFFRMVKIPAGQTSTSFTVPTADDRFDEEDGAVRAVFKGSLHRGRWGPGRNGEYYYWARNPRVAWVTVEDNEAPPPPHVPAVVNVSAERRFSPSIGRVRSDGTVISEKPIVATGDKVAAGEEAQFCIGRDSGAARLKVTTEWVYRTTGSRDTWTPTGVTHGVQLSSGTREMCLELDTTGRAGQTVGLRVVPARQRYELHGARQVTPYVAGSTAIATREVTARVVSTVSFTGGDRSVTEGDAPLELSISLDPPPPAPVTLRFRVSGTDFTTGATQRDNRADRARWASDFYIQRMAWNKTLKVPADAATATLTMHVIDDDKLDSGETVEIEMLAGDRVSPHATLGSMTVTILNHEAPPGQKGGYGYRQQLTEADWTDYQTVVNFLVEVRDSPKNTAVKGNPAHVAKWNRVLAAIGHASPEQPMPASEIHANAAKWSDSPFKAASAYLKSLEQDPKEPEITVSANAASVTEGGSATFTLTATPAPAATLPVSVSVTASGDYGVTAGTRTVNIPTTGSATLTLTTTDDDADEPDGSATVTVQAGGGYTVGSPASGTVTIRDDDLPPTVVTVAAKAGSVTEGGDAAFTLTADRAPDADLSVTLSVSETGEGDHVAAPDEGPATVTIPKDATEATFAVATVDDDLAEPDGSAVVTVQAGEGYTVGEPASASVTVRDDDITVLPSLSVADVTAREGVDFLVPFTVRLSAPSAETVEVRVDTRPSTPVSARPGSDYFPRPVGGHRLVFRAGETEKPVRVLVLDDNHDEEPETFEFVLSDAKGATIGDGVAVGTIENADPLPAAFLARFGRTLAQQTLT